MAPLQLVFHIKQPRQKAGSKLSPSISTISRVDPYAVITGITEFFSPDRRSMESG